MTDLKVLISGAGIAGPVVAHFLAKAGAQVTVIERAPQIRTGGQNVDVRGHGLTILQRMGVEEAVRTKITHEKGLRFVDGQNRSWADFPVGKGEGFTSEFEIMRGDLGDILYEASKNDAEYVFGESIKALTENEDGVVVEFESGMPARTVDVVVAADGWASLTRKLAFGPDVSRSAVNDLGQWTAWCTIPHRPSDANWARWCNFPGKRMILLRPDNTKRSRVSCWIMPGNDSLDKVLNQSLHEQKQHWAKLFRGAGWESDRVADGILEASDFYMQKIAQVKLPSWHQGRVVVAGDAGYCPSPISGMGTTVAIVGSYILAGELSRTPQDPQTAFRAYEQSMRDFVTKAQKLAPGAPSMANPSSAWGIWVLYSFLSLVAWTQSWLSMGASFVPPAKAMDLAEYSFERKQLYR